MEVTTNIYNYSLDFEKVNILIIGYSTKVSKSSLSCFNTTHLLQVLTRVGLHVMFCHTKTGSHRYMNPPQAYLTGPRIECHIRGILLVTKLVQSIISIGPYIYINKCSMPPSLGQCCRSIIRNLNNLHLTMMAEGNSYKNVKEGLSV